MKGISERKEKRIKKAKFFSFISLTVPNPKMSMNENEKLVKDNLTIYLARVHYYPHCSEIILNKRN